MEIEIYEPKEDREIPNGTVTRAKATCLCCGTVLPPERVRAQLSAQRGGEDAVFDAKGNRISGARMLAVVTIQSSIQGRQYRLPTYHDYQAVWKAQKRLKAIFDEWDKSGKSGLCPVPDEPTPTGGGSGAGRAFSVQKYGMMIFGDLFTARQKIGLAALSRLVDVLGDLPTENVTCKNSMALVASRCADYNSAYARWAASGEFVGNTFGRQALGPSWEFCETFLFSSESGGYPGALEWVARVIDSQALAINSPGQTEPGDACRSPLPDESCGIWFTDPPYYDAVPYSDLSDYFFVWQKRSFQSMPRVRSDLPEYSKLPPKNDELVQDETKKWNNKRKDKSFFEERMAVAFSEGRRVLKKAGKGVVRLLSIQERAKALFGEDGAQAVADRLESSRGASPQLMLFPQPRKDAPLPIKGRKKRPAADVSDEALRTQRGATTLDRVHAAMLLQANGRANALRALLKDEQERGPDFLRLANALSALYPKDSEEKRLLDAMLLAMPR